MAEDIVPGAVEAPRQSDIIERSAGGDGPLSAREAAASLADTRHKDAVRQRRDDEHAGSVLAQDAADKEARDDAPVRRSAEREGGTARQEPAAQDSREQADTAQETGPGET
jgi:hypothetical protein